MKVKDVAWLAARAITGILCMIVTFDGLLSIYGLDFRVDTLISILFCSLPAMSIFVTLFARSFRRELILHTVIAFGYWSSFAVLSWRTCSALGYCGTYSATAFQLLRVTSVQAAFGAIVFTIIARLLDEKASKTHRRN